MLPGLDGGVEVKRPEAWGRGQDYEVDVGQIKEPLGGVEARKPAVLWAVDLALHLLDALERTVNAVLKRVCDRRELDVRPGH